MDEDDRPTQSVPPALDGTIRIVRIAFLGVPLYAQPAEDARKLAYLNRGTVMEVLDERGGFLQVRTADGASGYVLTRSSVPA